MENIILKNQKRLLKKINYKAKKTLKSTYNPPILQVDYPLFQKSVPVTNGRTDGGEIKGPFGFHPGPKKL